VSWGCQQFVIFRWGALFNRARDLQSHFGAAAAAEGVHVIASTIKLPFSLAGAGCVLHTNCAALAKILEQPLVAWDGVAVCELHVEVVTADVSPLSKPHFRGTHHIVVASFGAANVFVFDLRRRIVSARVSEVVAQDVEFWHRTVLPIMAGVLGATIGLLPLHSACLARNGNGMLIAGESGAGKSTLAVALAQQNFDYISDDWTYCTAAYGDLTVPGTAARVKLLPDAARHFPLLHEHEVGVSMNGELAFEVRADEVFGARLQRNCTPRMLVFYCRTQETFSRFTRLDRSAARLYMEANVERLPAQLEEAANARSRLMDRVAELPCWKFECGGPPGFIAQELEAFFDAQQKEWTA
jgi:hypothetical protein